MAEGAPLLREYGLKTHRGFESLSLRQIKNPAPGGVFYLTEKESGLEPWHEAQAGTPARMRRNAAKVGRRHDLLRACLTKDI